MALRGLSRSPHLTCDRVVNPAFVRQERKRLALYPHKHILRGACVPG